ncbi:LOW QUALITY PROTEIN: hypothetical protein SETIT_2G175400v2 [Setaria italica]|uniref:F-box domain-containing protein n=1 Tax=Setaria italica TaxID=4555 RepID=A0A368PZT7_SETIT|nr:LOW QUALITY PROTEIN: hypothetical protein SETIT_2G175400v2 [Setaria italica]
MEHHGPASTALSLAAVLCCLTGLQAAHLYCQRAAVTLPPGPVRAETRAWTYANVAIPDDIVELILLRLDLVICLTRAASTNGAASFRRRLPPPLPLSAHTARRRRRLPQRPEDPTPILHPVAVGDRRRPPLLPRLPPWHLRSIWSVKDSRGSLLLLDRFHLEKGTGWLSDLVVCEPLTWRYEIIPPLSTSTNYQYQLVEAFLVDNGDGTEEGCDGMSNFRVLCVLQGYNRTYAGVFTSGSTSWWGRIFGGQWTSTLGLTTRSIYFYSGEGRVTSMDLSTAGRVIIDWDGGDGHMSWCSMTVTAGRESEPLVVVGELGCNVKVYARQHGSGGEWALQKSIELSEATRGLLRFGCWDLIQAASLSHYRPGSVLIQQESGSRVTCFRLDVETVEMQMLPDQNAYSIEVPLPWK